MKGFDFMIKRGYAGNRSLRSLKRVTPNLQAKIRRIFNGEWNDLEDENIHIFTSGDSRESSYTNFSYLKHDISADLSNGIVTVFEYDYYGAGFWANEAREIGNFHF